MNVNYISPNTARMVSPNGYVVSIGAAGSGKNRPARTPDAADHDDEAPRRRLMTTTEAATYCGLAKNTLEKMRLYGRKGDNSPRFIKLGTAVRYHPDDLDAWIDRNRAITTSEYDPTN
jgi:predicted DNA-binding transcriptional regulator AlpA